MVMDSITCKIALNTILCRTEEKEKETNSPPIPPPETFVGKEEHEEKKKKKKKHKKKKKRRRSKRSDGASSVSMSGSEYSGYSASTDGSHVSEVPISVGEKLTSVQEEENNELGENLPRNFEQNPSRNHSQSVGGLSVPTSLSQVDMAAFISKLKNGEYKVKKHGRAGKPKLRILKLSEDQKTISWVPAKKLLPVNHSDPRYHNLVESIVEVRSATEIDRQNPRYLGTAILRRSCDPDQAPKALSILWETRSLDLEFEDEQQASEFLNGMRVFISLSATEKDGEVL
mmetsp:Transcript_27810/g.36187  ORF Transcript_27810/g.36187 Transcript_27810/m.36187 type:complete len:286 (+) Transcript_27810:207-1064(+)